MTIRKLAILLGLLLLGTQLGPPTFIATASTTNSQLTLKWSQKLLDGFSPFLDRELFISNNVIGLGTAYGSESQLGNNTFYALDSETGKVAWTIPLRNGSDIGVAWADEKLFIAGFFDPNLPSDRRVRIEAIDSQTGNIVWSVEEPFPSSLGIYPPDLVVSYNSNRGLVAYDIYTGQVKWTMQGPQAAKISDLAFGGWGDADFNQGYIYQTTTEQNVVAFDTISRAIKWSRHFDYSYYSRYMNEVVSVIQATINSTNPLSNPNQAVMTIHLVGLNAANGNTVWNKTIGYWRAQISGDIEQDIHECPVVKNGRIFALSNTGYNQTPADIVAINVTNGNQIWRQSFPQVKYQIQGGFMKYEPVILQKDAISDSLLFVSVGPTLYGLNTSTGAVTWSNSLPNGGNWIAKKYLDGRLYAFRMPLNQPMEIAAFEQTQSKPIPEIPVWFTTVSLTAAFFSAQLATVKRRTKRNCGAMRDFV